MPVNRIDLLRLGVADVGEMPTLQRAAYMTEAQLHNDPMLPPLTQTLDELRAELSDPRCTAWGIRESHRLPPAHVSPGGYARTWPIARSTPGKIKIRTHGGASPHK
ncbi:MAG TPA: hypothetical protein VE733_13250 [Streptosporangiaceae bacterium]|nr:hypothetical protein [Streptosporangiaceae bacterium]